MVDRPYRLVVYTRAKVPRGEGYCTRRKVRYVTSLDEAFRVWMKNPNGVFMQLHGDDTYWNWGTEDLARKYEDRKHPMARLIR